MSLAFVFPGQGSQSVGMLAELAAVEPAVRETFAEASDALDYDLWQLTQDGPDEVLNLTWRTQPAMLAAGVAVYRAWLARGGPQPVAMAGHSLGEYTALVCAGSIGLHDATALVEFRGRAMQDAVPDGEGGMAAILGLDDDKVREACVRAAAAGIVEPVNFNAPGQVVVAGHRAAIERAVEEASALGARRTVTLAVSVPSHSSLMQPAAERLAERLESVDLKVPGDTTIYSVDLEKHATEAGIRAALVRQLVRPVRWSETVATMIADGADAIVECGPGKTLTSLNRRIDRRRDIAMLAIGDPASLDAALARIGGDSTGD